MFKFWNKYDEIEQQVPPKYWNIVREFAFRTSVEALSERDRYLVLDNISDFVNWLRRWANGTDE